VLCLPPSNAPFNSPPPARWCPFCSFNNLVTIEILSLASDRQPWTLLVILPVLIHTISVPRGRLAGGRKLKYVIRTLSSFLRSLSSTLTSFLVSTQWQDGGQHQAYILWVPQKKKIMHIPSRSLHKT
jgi:hypothetical protein